MRWLVSLGSFGSYNKLLELILLFDKGTKWAITYQLNNEYICLKQTWILLLSISLQMINTYWMRESVQSLLPLNSLMMCKHTDACWDTCTMIKIEVLFMISYKHLAAPFFLSENDEKHGLQNQTPRIQVSTDHLLAMCPWGALLNLPVVQFPHLWDVDKITSTSSGLMRSKWANPCKALKTTADP